MEDPSAENNMKIDQTDTKVPYDSEIEENENEPVTDKNEMEVELEHRPSTESNEQGSHTPTGTRKASSLAKASQSPNTLKETSSKPQATKANGNSKSTTEPDQKTENPYSKKKNNTNSTWSEKGTMKDVVLGEKNKRATGLYHENGR